jgi:hypothetical protein
MNSRPERQELNLLSRFAYDVSKTKPIYNIFFVAEQLTRLAVLNSKHIPTRTVWLGTLSRFYYRQMFVHAAAVAKAVCPACLIGQTQALRTKRLDDFDDQFGLPVGVVGIFDHLLSDAAFAIISPRKF